MLLELKFSYSRLADLHPHLEKDLAQPLRNQILAALYCALGSVGLGVMTSRASGRGPRLKRLGGRGGFGHFGYFGLSSPCAVVGLRGRAAAHGAKEGIDRPSIAKHCASGLHDVEVGAEKFSGSNHDT